MCFDKIFSLFLSIIPLSLIFCYQSAISASAPPPLVLSLVYRFLSLVYRFYRQFIAGRRSGFKIAF